MAGPPPHVPPPLPGGSGGGHARPCRPSHHGPCPAGRRQPCATPSLGRGQAVAAASPRAWATGGPRHRGVIGLWDVDRACPSTWSDALRPQIVAVVPPAACTSCWRRAHGRIVVPFAIAEPTKAS